MAFHYLTNFELMCYNYQVILAAREELKEGLKILDNKTGNMVINPSETNKTYQDLDILVTKGIEEKHQTLMWIKIFE